MHYLLLVTCLLLSNVLAVKLLRIGNWSITAGVLVFMVSVFALAIIFPAQDWYEMSDEFTMILGSTPRITIADLAAYLSGLLVSTSVMNKMKAKSVNGRKFGLRALASTIVGETVDSCVFVPIAFCGLISIKQIINMMVIQIVLKTLGAISGKIWSHRAKKSFT